MTELALTLPRDFPGESEQTSNRRLLEAIVSGLAPPPPCVPRFALPRPSAWSHGVLVGLATPTDTETWAPGIVFGGYLACLVDQFAGLVMLTVLPDRASFLTAGLSVDLHNPMRPGDASVSARIVRLSRRSATIEVLLEQHAKTVGVATVRQVIRL
jgi:acyl-coenzyme A thioesterase PaaI-like protein